MPARILAVDDEPGMLKLLAMIIREKAPHTVETTNNPVEAEQIVLGIERALAWSALQRENRALKERLEPPRTP